MIQDIAPEVFRNQFVPGDHHPDPHDVVFIFDGRTVLCRVLEDGEIVFPRVADFAGGLPETPVYLFAIEDPAAEGGHLEFYLLREKDSARALGDGWQFGNIRLMRTIHPKDLCFAGMTGFQLYCWYRDNTFCGRCGGKTVYSDTERAIKCPACGNTIYPKVQPAVIIGLTDGDRILMSRYAGREHKGNALLAGFCEIGETAEETVAREVMEEVGLTVTNIRYYKSQPWGIESDLLLGYYCDVTGAREIRLDENELAAARWVQRDDIGQEDSGVSLTAEMIMRFKEHPEEFAS